MSVLLTKTSSFFFCLFVFFGSVFLKYIFAIHFTVIKSVSTGETCRTNMSVYDACGFVGFGLVTHTLIVIDTRHGLSGLLLKFVSILDVCREVVEPLDIIVFDPVYLFDFNLTFDFFFSLLQPTN